MLRGCGGRLFIWASAVHDDLRIPRIVLDDGIGVGRVRRDGTRNNAILFASIFRPHVENDEILTIVDHLPKFGDGDAVHAKLADKQQPLRPFCHHEQNQCGGDGQNAKLAEVGKCGQDTGDRILEYPAERDRRTDKQELAGCVEQEEHRQGHLGNAGHRHRKGRKPRKEFRKQQ